MRVLGIDTSAPSGAVGFLDGEQVVFSEKARIKPGGSELIPALLAEALERTGRTVRELELITVGIGPGSYTGVRVGLAIGKGLAFGCGIPLVGVPTLEALAVNSSGTGLICALAKSRPGEVYAGFYRRQSASLKEVSPPAIWTVSRLGTVLQEKGEGVLFLGEVSAEVKAELSTFLNATAAFGRETENLIDGAHLARLGREKWERTQTNELDTVLPLYLRRTEAEVRWEERSGRADVSG